MLVSRLFASTNHQRCPFLVSDGTNQSMTRPPQNWYTDMNPTTRFWTRLLPTLVLAGSLSVMGSLSHAALLPKDEAPLVRIDPEILEHLRTEIRDRNPDRRENALVDVIAIATCQSPCTVQLRSLPGESVRFNDAENALAGLGPVLLRAYRSGPTDQHRLLALSALMNVGDEEVIDRLIEKPVPVSFELDRKTQQHIAAFYLDRYPELQRRAERTGTISIDDVKVARARHERVLRKQARRG